MTDPRTRAVPGAEARRGSPPLSSAAIDRVDRLGLVHPRAGSRGVRSGVRRGLRRRPCGRRRHRHRRHRAAAARAGHRPGRRGDHRAAVGGLLGARGDDGGRAAGVCRHRPGTAHDRSGGGGGRDHVAHQGAPARAPLRPAGRHDSLCWRSPSGIAWRWSRTARRRTWRRARAARWGRSASPARSASIRPRTSARWATAERSSPATRALAARLKRLRNGGQTTRYHHDEVRREHAARRDAGGDPARAPRAPRRVDGPPARDRARPTGPGCRRRGSACRRSSTPATSITCSRC